MRPSVELDIAATVCDESVANEIDEHIAVFGDLTQCSPLMLLCPTVMLAVVIDHYWSVSQFGPKQAVPKCTADVSFW